MDLVEILKRPEGKTLEFKRELSAPGGALKTIIAFANTAGGILLLASKIAAATSAECENHWISRSGWRT